MIGTKKIFKGPLWVQIGISKPCNHRCIMCWDHPAYVPKDSPYPTLLSKEFKKELESRMRRQDRKKYIMGIILPFIGGFT